MITMTNTDFKQCNCGERGIHDLQGFENHLCAKGDIWHRAMHIDYMVRGGHRAMLQGGPTCGFQFQEETTQTELKKHIDLQSTLSAYIPEGFWPQSKERKNFSTKNMGHRIADRHVD